MDPAVWGGTEAPHTDYLELQNWERPEYSLPQTFLDLTVWNHLENLKIGTKIRQKKKKKKATHFQVSSASFLDVVSKKPDDDDRIDRIAL